MTFDIRAIVAELDEEYQSWEEIGEDHSVREYENHEDAMLAFGESAELWVRTALRVLSREAIDAVDAKINERFESELDTASSGSVQHYIETGRYLTHAEVAEQRAREEEDR